MRGTWHIRSAITSIIPAWQAGWTAVSGGPIFGCRRPFDTPKPMQPEQLSPTLPYAAWADAFTPSELDRVEAIGDALTLDKAVLLGSVPDEEYSHIRVTRTAWIKPDPDTKWIFDRVQAALRSLNDRIWQFDLRGFAD